MDDKTERQERWWALPVDGVPWDVAVQVEVVRGGASAVGLQLTPHRDADGNVHPDSVISKESLRRLPLRAIRREAARLASPTLQEEMPWGESVPSEKPAGRPYPKEHYRRVASAYELAVEANLPPVALIKETWMVSRPTAAKWVRKARELELLGYPEKRGRPGSSAKTSPYSQTESKKQ